ncbi:PadR family transcriptional regulator [Murinocardiopsis flavida]|uniref:PadR family transcriptional regulator n=1 Tax=Murinocardiopsis flavida TaxID=645275 RepID=A0A2P8DR14_9ACTN|nr:PadR family transcriptional regulator [Murinocardiopsis flavida]PSK99661.1 PadR family transcriptional regulator [Murinocardiopsis flavida]
MAGKRRGVTDLTGLTVLALLHTGPRHPYEMHRIVLETHKDFVTGLPRSLYHAVTRLERDEFIESVETVREGGRPERTVYRLTAEGRAELTSRLRYLLQRPDTDPRPFVAAMSFIGCLPIGETRFCLGHRAAALESEVASLDISSTSLGLPRVLLLENEYLRALRAAELEWVRTLIADLDSGALSWPDDMTELSKNIPGGMTRSD